MLLSSVMNLISQLDAFTIVVAAIVITIFMALAFAYVRGLVNHWND